MRPVAAALLLALGAPPAAGFLALPRSQGGAVQSHNARMALPAMVRAPADAGQTEERRREAPGALAAGAALLAALLLTRGVGRSGKTAVRGNGIKLAVPASLGMQRDTDLSRGPDYKLYLKLGHFANKSKTYGTTRINTRRNLAEAGISAFRQQLHLWYPKQHTWNMYQGPESVTENPDFPAASDGYRGMVDPARMTLNALPGGALSQLSSSAGRQGKSCGLFVTGHAPTFGSRKRLVHGSRAAVVMHAHKMAASCTKNQQNGSNVAKHWGISLRGRHGEHVKAGTLLVKQKGTKYYPGGGVTLGRNNDITAKRDGMVQWRGKKKHMEVSVVPWEYVAKKCEWHEPTNPGKTGITLVPKEYAPWMGTHMHDGTATRAGASHGLRRPVIAKKRELWLETPEGQAWTAKKNEKKARQKEFREKYKALKKQRWAAAKASGMDPRVWMNKNKGLPPPGKTEEVKVDS